MPRQLRRSRRSLLAELPHVRRVRRDLEERGGASSGRAGRGWRRHPEAASRSRLRVPDRPAFLAARPGVPVAKKRLSHNRRDKKQNHGKQTGRTGARSIRQIEERATARWRKRSGEWEARLRSWRRSRFWLPLWGPRPGKDGCFAPPDLCCPRWADCIRRSRRDHHPFPQVPPVDPHARS